MRHLSTEVRRIDRKSRSLVANVGLAHERAEDAFEAGDVHPFQDGLLVRHGQKDQVVRSVVPLGRFGRVLYGELECGVCCLSGLQSGGEIRPAQDVELVGGCWGYLVIGHVATIASPSDKSTPQPFLHPYGGVRYHVHMANETVYNKAKVNFANGTLDFDTDDIRVALCEGASAAGAYDPDVTSLATLFAAMAEASGTGYVRKSTLGCSVATDNTNNRAVLKVPAQTWTGANWGNATAVVVYKHVDGTNANDYPISFHDGGFPVTTNGGDLTVRFGGAGNDEAIYLT